MKSNASAACLRTRLQDGDLSPIRLIGVHDAIGAKLAERAGFDGLWASGLGISAAIGLPDIGLISAPELLRASEAISSLVSIPTIVDCDTGFGGINNAILMFQRFAQAGLSGVCIEDKEFPKRNSLLFERHALTPIAEFCEKLSALRRLPLVNAPVLIARTEALVAGRSVSEALERADAYEVAGAEAILVQSKQLDGHEILDFLDHWKGRIPVVVVPTTYPHISHRELAKKGARVVILANQLLRGYISSCESVLSQLATSDSGDIVESQIATVSSILGLVDTGHWQF